MNNDSVSEFWTFFNTVAAPHLARREATFRTTFEYLDQFPTPITIVETGCLRVAGNWADGQSTALFDKYVSTRGGGSRVYSVDINEGNVAVCRSLTSDHVQVTCAGSVAYLNRLTRELQRAGTRVNLFYLDSFDVDFTYWFASAAHHMKELLAASRCIDSDTLIVVDDCPVEGRLDRQSDGTNAFHHGLIGGKGRLIGEYARQVGVEPMFSGYQAGWKGF